MATITGLTAERMEEIEAASVVDGDVVADNLILTKHDGSTIDAGSVRGAPGPPGALNAIYSDIWSWTTSTSAASSSGQVGLNAATWALTTQINLNEATKDGRNVSVLAFPRIAVGDQLYIQHKTDAARNAYFTVTGAGTDHGTWWSWPVSFDSGLGAVPGGTTDTNVSLIKLGATSIPVQDEGTTLTARSKLNFIGGGVTAADDSANDRTNVTIPGAVQTTDLLPYTLSGTTYSPNTQTANYTLVLGDAGKTVEMNLGSDLTLTVPPNSSVAFPVGTIIEVARYGSGGVTIAAGSGVTIRSRGGLLTIGNRYGAVSLRKRATDEWVLVGDLA